MDNDYWSVDAIFTSNQKLDCTFELEVPNLGHIDGGEERNIAAQTKMQLPYWMALQLVLNGYLKPRIPPSFTLRVRKALNAEPKSVKLSSLVGGGVSWYSFGKEISDMLEEPQKSELVEVLQKAFQARIIDLVDQAQHFNGMSGASSTGGHESGNDFRQGLDNTERELFMLAQNSALQTKSWYDSTDRR